MTQVSKIIFQVNKYEASKEYTTNYTNVRIYLHLSRRLEGVMISTVVPAFLFVAISYISLFMPYEFVAVRASICLFMLLNM